MKHFKNLRRPPVTVALATSLLGALLGSGCLTEEGGIVEGASAAAGESAGEAAGASASEGGTKQTAGAANVENGGDGHEHQSGGAPPTAGSASGGTAGADPHAQGGSDDELPAGGMPGAGGQPDEEAHIGDPCAFHTLPDPLPLPAGEGGAGGAGAANVLLQPSAFVGTYLTDSAGRTLYTYGADLPGDCQTPPQSVCVADCLVSWPVFHASERALGEGLDDAAFGAVQRADGAWQTTYMGWPLYYYKSDLALGQMTGQGKGKIWHVAELVPPTITVMRAGATLKYLADAYGRTLYVSAADQAGSALQDPISNCKGTCLKIFEPFHARNFSTVTILEPLDFSVFTRKGSSLQLSYKGLPLYRAATDLKSGDMTGLAVEGFTVAVP
ncbi:MAG: hypothetical protein EOO73_12190 [Myxococcales bacterium]|nr:MAG: hypothetical protein EOO73_12190 [Myxococcales bacterium]